MSNVFIVVDGNNLDRNSMAEIAQAVAYTGANIIEVDDQKYLIEAAVPAHEVPTVAAMEGVAYVRCVFTYLCDGGTDRAA